MPEGYRSLYCMTAMNFLLFALLAATFEQTITVTGERLEQPQVESAAAVTVLTREEIERLPAASLGEVLRFVPGFQIMDVRPGAPAMTSTRGFFGGGEVEYVQLLVDGVPGGDAESGLAPWGQIAAADIERIEVLRGPGSSLFGDAALGGVVQVFRRDSGAHLAAAAGSFSLREVSGSVSAPAGAAHLSAHGRYVSSDGFRDHSAFDQWAAGVRFRRGRIEGTIDGSAVDREEPGQLSAAEMRSDRSGSNAVFRGDYEDTTRVRGSLGYSAETWRLLLDAGRRDSDAVRTFLLAPGLGDTAHRLLDTTRIGVSGSGERSLSPSVRASYGADVARETIDVRYTAAGAGSGRRDRAAVFFSGEWRLTPRMRLSGGARWDGVEDRFSGLPPTAERAFSPRLALGADLGGTHVYVQAARAFKAPTLDQRYDPRPFPDFAGGTFTISNPTLEAQKAWSVEAGVRGQRSGVRWEAAAYRMDVDDEIDLDAATFRYRNIGQSRHTGLESRVEWSAGPVQPALEYTWTRAEPLQGPGRDHQLRNIAEHVVRGQLATRERNGFAATVALEHSSDRYLDDANLLSLDDVTAVDLRLMQRIRSARIVVDARNLTDEEYAPVGFVLPDFEGTEHQYFYPAPGRSLEVRLEWQLATGAAP